MEKALKLLRGLRSVSFATISEGKPQSRIIDVMFIREDGLYFMTCKSKPFYRQLRESPHVAITGMTQDFVQIRLTGEVEVVSSELIDQIYRENQDFDQLFPRNDDHAFMEVFRVFRGKGEIFDLSGKEVKMKRHRFAFGGEKVRKSGCEIQENCIGCGRCQSVCPFQAIQAGSPYGIDSELCDECGRCLLSCPVDAIALPTGL
ncbi:4Fe-4S binding protein [Gottschalkiaceae bacterium SANA]|nr:4Fe-4S binding protein [Gottschalkiaceae bacterium SANA]